MKNRSTHLRNQSAYYLAPSAGSHAVSPAPSSRFLLVLMFSPHISYLSSGELDPNKRKITISSSLEYSIGGISKIWPSYADMIIFSRTWNYILVLIGESWVKFELYEEGNSK